MRIDHASGATSSNRISKKTCFFFLILSFAKRIVTMSGLTRTEPDAFILREAKKLLENENLSDNFPGLIFPLEVVLRGQEIKHADLALALLQRFADDLGELAVFDIGGNNFRMISSIDYAIQRVYILEMMTHSEYDRWKA